MLTSLNPSSLWSLPPKQRLATFLSQAPAVCRVAPSPTGLVHLGTLRTALHNFLAARASGGMFFLRIDDTDHARNQAGADQAFQRSLDRLGLVPAFVFHQSHRLAAHRAAAQALLDAGLAIRDQGAVRLKPGLAADLLGPRFFDLAAGVCAVGSAQIQHADALVLMRSDGNPTYHLASIVDDIHAGATLILRGSDHLANTPKQMALAQALAKAGWPGAAAFCQSVCVAHVGLIMKKGKKLSKRDADSDAVALLDAGIAPDALLHWSLVLGWGHPAPDFDRRHPILDLDGMVDVFPQGGLRSTNSNLQLDKLQALQRSWVKSRRGTA